MFIFTDSNLPTFFLSLYIIMASIPPSAVPFVQGQDVARLNATVDTDNRDVKYYTAQCENKHKIIIEALGATVTDDEKRTHLVHR